MKKKILSLILAIVMLMMAVPTIASATTSKPSIDAILAEYEKWGSVPYEQRADYPKDMRIPFKTMWVVYTNMIVDGKEYHLSDEAKQDFPAKIAAYETFIEKNTNNNVDIINEYVFIDRRIAVDNLFNSFDLKTEEDLYGVNKYNELAIILPVEEGVDNPFFAYAFCTGIFPSQARSIGVFGSFGTGYTPHELIHSFEVLIGNGGKSKGIEGMGTSGLHNITADVGEILGQTNILQANVKVTDPNTGAVSYRGIYPSMWQYVVDWQSWYATQPKPVITQPTEPDLSSASDWAKDGIKKAIGKGFVPGDLQSNYTAVITRQEFCRMAIKWLEYYTEKTVDEILAEKGLSRAPNAFTDTNDPDILAAFALGITNGTGPKTFTPDGQFSREQAATMIRNVCRVVGKVQYNIYQVPTFVDMNTASSWAVEGIQFVSASYIMNGTSTDPNAQTFSPHGTYTRQESIVTFNRIIK